MVPGARVWFTTLQNSVSGINKNIGDRTSILSFRMHLTYAFIRLISTLNDLFVFYHAKGLKLIDDAEKKTEIMKETIQMNSIPE